MKPTLTPEQQELITRGVTNVIVQEDLEKKLASGKPLRIKLGIDPTGPRLHIGRAIPLRKLRDFQRLGHQIVLIIGDFTALVGDASDKDAERPMITREQIEENMKTYLQQFSKILDIDACEVHYNSTWLAPLGFYDIAKLAQQFSVAQMLDRDNFSKRYNEGKRISLHEFLYPLMQGYDSVAIRSDVELGGNDQLFNVLAGRTLQKANEQKPQNVMTFELLEGTDGRKMSTSWGNAIYLEDAPEEMFGKIMSVRDELIIRYFTLCTDESLEQIAEYEQMLKSGENPRNIKVALAKSLVTLYHDAAAADRAYEHFQKLFVKKDIPDDIPEKTILSGTHIIDAIVDHAGFAPSRSEARRLIQGNGVKWNQEPISDLDFVIYEDGILQVGKRKFLKIKI